MRADLTRGHRPDAKRGKKYRRVLLQEGRLLLDSDWAALVDAHDASFRDLSRDLACSAGSPNDGLVVTAGQVVAWFVELEDPIASAAPFRFHRDYQFKYRDRFPSLYVDGRQAAGNVTFSTRRTGVAGDFAYGRAVRIWARAGGQFEIRFGTSVHVINGLDANNFQPYEVTPAGVGSFDTIRVGFVAANANAEAWIGLIETRQNAGAQPSFWATRGAYHLGGLRVEIEQDRAHPLLAFPFAPAAINPGNGTQWLAYVEGWERLITGAEDEGLLEQALGGVLDTAARTHALGQVKLARCFATADQVRAAFRNIDRGSATLSVLQAPPANNNDPCAIPQAGGYTGGKNLLYRFEVHDGGAIGAATVKWSRDNGSRLYRVINTNSTATDTVLTLTPGADVSSGDYVELVDDRIDLMDEVDAQVAAGPPRFVPSERRTGELYRAERTGAATVRLLSLATSQGVGNLQPAAGDPPRRVRVWNGLMATAGNPAVTQFNLGDGINVTLGGADFRPGDFWVFEARKLADNANGPPQLAPHGPERLFAPLALLDYVDPNQPFGVLRWYDDQFSPLCDLTADDIAYDGDSSNTEADTVQEAIDELYRRETNGCCTAHLAADGQAADDAARINLVLANALQNGGVLCLGPGVYRLRSPIVIQGVSIELRGCPDAVLIGEVPNAPAFSVRGTAELVLSDLILRTADPFNEALVELRDQARFTARRTALLHMGAAGPATAIRTQAMPAAIPAASSLLSPANPADAAAAGPYIRLDEATIAASVALALTSARAVTIERSVLHCSAAAIHATSVSGLDVFESVLDVNLTAQDRGLIAGALPNNIAREVIAVIEAGAAAAPATGHAVYAGEIRHARVQDSLLVGETGIRIGAALRVRFAANEIRCLSLGLRIDNARETALTDNVIVAGNGIAIHLPVTARELEISRNEVEGRLGIYLGPEGAQSVVGIIVMNAVRIAENRVAATELGIRVGGGSTPIAIGRTRQVSIEGNSIEGVEIGVVATSLIPSTFVAEPGYAASVRVAANFISALHVGVWAQGTNLEVADNTITMMNGAPNPPAGVLVSGIWVKSADRAIVEDNFVRNLGELAIDHVRADSSNDVTVSGNRTERAGAYDHGINATSCSWMRVTDNRFNARRNRVSGSPIDFRGNWVAGLLEANSSDIVISENRFEGVEGSLSVTGAAARSQIENNRASGYIMVLPQIDFTWSYGDVMVGILEKPEFREIVTTVLGNRPPRGLPPIPGGPEPAPGPRPGPPPPIDPRAERAARASRYGRASPYLAASAAEAGSPLALDYVAPEARAASSSRYAMSASNAEARVEGIAETMGYTITETMVDIFTTFFAQFLSGNERAFHAQVEGNWAAEIQVGYAHPDEKGRPPGRLAFEPHDNTVVQVIGNRADQLLLMNRYRREVVTGNMSRDLHGLNDDPPPVNQENIVL